MREYLQLLDPEIQWIVHELTADFAKSLGEDKKYKPYLLFKTIAPMVAKAIHSRHGADKNTLLSDEKAVQSAWKAYLKERDLGFTKNISIFQVSELYMPFVVQAALNQINNPPVVYESYDYNDGFCNPIKIKMED